MEFKFDWQTKAMFTILSCVLIAVALILSIYPNACVQYQGQTSLVCRKPFTQTYLLCSQPNQSYYFGLLPLCSTTVVSNPFKTPTYNGITTTNSVFP